MPYIRYVESRRPLLVAALLFTCASITACAHRVASPKSQAPPSGTMASKPALIPWPVSVALNDTERFGLDKDLVIEVSPNQPQLQRIGQELSKILSRPALDVAIPVRPLSPTTPNGAIRFEIGSPGADAGDEGYELTITGNGRPPVGGDARGIFYGVQHFASCCRRRSNGARLGRMRVSVATGRIADRPALRLARRDARRGPALLRPDRSQALHRPAGALQVQPLAPASLRRPGLAHRDRSWPRLTAYGGCPPSAAARRVLHEAGIRRSRALRALRASSRSSPRSTCPATPTRRWPRTPS